MKSRDKLLVVISITLIIAIVEAYSLFFGSKQIAQDSIEIIKQVLPNLLASLITFLAIYFILDKSIDEKSSNIQVVGYLKSAEEVARQYGSSLSPNELKKLENTFKDEQKILKLEIKKLAAILNNSSNPDEKQKIEAELTNLYLKLNSVDLKVSAISERFKIFSDLEEKNNEIEKLNHKIQQLHDIINAHKTSAQTIVETASKA